MNLSELSYKPKLGGGSHGTMMIHATVEGPESPSRSYEVMDVVNRCEEIVKMMSMKVKLMLVKPTMDAPSEEVTKLLMMLKDRKFVVGLILEGFSIPVYARESQFIQAIVRDPNWDNYKVHELIYKPDGGELTEPTILENNFTCNKYVYVGKKDQVRDVITFINNARFLWALIVPPSKDVSVDFLGG
jgi:hypothetical protein